MGAFKIEIVGVGGHGCERKAKPGDKLHGRCGRFTCPDCAAYEFVQRMRQSGMVRDNEVAYTVRLGLDVLQQIKDAGLLDRAEEYFEVKGNYPFIPVGAAHIGVRGGTEIWAAYPMRAEFTHWPGQDGTVVDDMLKNERKSGSF